MTNKKTLYIQFFTGIELNAINKMTKLVLEQMREGVERIVFLLSSPGGNVYAGLSAYNFLRGIPVEVVTHNYGSVDSIAAILFCAGAKRLCVPHARFNLHGATLDIKTPIQYSEKLLDERVRSLRMDREIFSQVVTDVTGRDRVQVERDILDGIVLNSEQALEYGLVHEIKTELFERGAKVLEIT
jgi:ATP-dependent Clp protease protease subunit